MVDFGVLVAVRKLICEKRIGAKYGLVGGNIFIMVPDVLPQTWPAVFLELEETWCPNVRSKRVPYARVAFKLSVFCNDNDGAHAIDISNQICSALNGLDLLLDEENLAAFKFKSSVVDFKKVLKQPRKVEQFYEAVIRSAKALDGMYAKSQKELGAGDL
ncbi:MAG: hypothetical protein LBF72_01985 [Holosporales bacterium]|jgi:hypothetical protein|nr:hypothetical protein [Holosporales bacterium]